MNSQELLKKIYLFRDATPPELDDVAAIAESKTYIGGECVYRVGDASDAFFVIASGTIDVILKDQDIPVGSVGAGQALGELAFFLREERLASAVAREATNLLRLPYAKLDQVLDTHPNLAAKVYRHGCGHLARQLRTIAPDLTRRYF